MSDRLSRVGSNPTLKQFIQGAARQSIAPFQEFLAPTVGVPTMTGKYKRWGEKSLLVIPSTKRGLKGEATIVGFDTSDAPYNLTPNALDYPVDELEQEDQGIMNSLQEGAEITAQLSSLSSLNETINLALATLGAGTDVNIAAGGADLVKSVDSALRSAILGAKGFAPMMEFRILWGFDAWTTFKNHSSVIGRFKGGAKKESTEITLENVTSLFTVPVRQQIATAVKDANTNKDAADIQFMLGNSLVVFAASPNPTRYDTSFMKSLRLREEYMSTRFYKRADGRVEFVGFDWNEEIIASTPSAGIRLNWVEA